MRGTDDPYDDVSPLHNWGPITLTVTVAECRCGRSHFSRPSQLRFSCATVSTPSANVTLSGSPSMLDTSSVGFPVVASTATEPAMSLTRSPVTSSNSRLVGVSMLHSLVGIPPVLPIGLPSTPNDISHLLKVKMYRE